MKTTQLIAAALTLATCLGASAAPEINGSVTISGNKAKNITVGGGSGGVSLGPIRAGGIDMTATANINSAVVKNGKIGGSVRIVNNTAEDLNVIGGAANVNSVVLGQ